MKELLQQIKNQISKIQASYDGMRHTKENINEYFKKQDQMFEELESLCNQVTGDGVQAGKMIHFGVGDGSAIYVIAKVNKTTVEVWHVPYSDAYRFQGVYMDSKGKLKLPIEVVERQCRHRLSSMFA